jgi:hypothetical protein
MKLMKGKITPYFDRILKNKIEFIPVIKLLHITEKMVTTAFESSKMKNKVNINNLHTILGYCDEGTDRMTGKFHGNYAANVFKACKACWVGKVRQNKISKDWKGDSVTAGEWLFVDISSFKGKRYGGSKFWELLVNDYSRYCWSYFLNRKSDLKVKLVELIVD